MELNEFINEVEIYFNKLSFVENIKVTRSNSTLRITINLEKKALLQIFYNKILHIQSFDLILNQKRIWGLDFDNKFGWHEHPMSNPEFHEKISEHTFEQIVNKFIEVWNPIYSV